MYKALLIICLLITSVQAHAQLSGQAKIDSLLAELPKAKGDTNEVKLLLSISYKFKGISPDKGIEYGQKGLGLAKKLNWKVGVAKCYSSIGINYISQSKYNEALDYFFRSLKISEEVGNKMGTSANLSNIGIIYDNQSNYPKALEYYFKALKISEEVGDKKSTSANLSNIGITYINRSNYPKALEYYFKALKISEELVDKSGIARNLGNLGVIYDYQSNYSKALEYYFKALKINKELGNKKGTSSNLSNIGNIYNIRSNYSKALEYYFEALKINEELDNKNGIALNLGNIGGVYALKSDYPKALEYYRKALDLHEELGNKSEIALNLGNMGELYLTLSQDSLNIKPSEINQYVSLNKEINLNKSIEYSSYAIKIFEEIGELKYKSDYVKNLADAYKQKGDMRNAYEALEEHHKFKDSVFSQENADKIAALEKAREDDLKQKEIEKQKLKIAEQEKREQLILYFSIGFFIVMSIVMFVIYRLLKRSDKLLYNVLPVSIAKRLKKKEHPISDYFTQASIVFIDIVNFTEMAKDEDPRRVVEALNKIFTHYDTIANKYGLEKIKTIGDSYMAAAGIPEVQKDNTHRAAQMALEVKELMENYHTADGTKIEVRIGLDCGPVVAGVIGENKFIYDMWSDAVNTASRMESSSESGQVHITERFKDAVSEFEQFEYVERGEIEIKGKGKMKTYYIENKEVVNV